MPPAEIVTAGGDTGPPRGGRGSTLPRGRRIIVAVTLAAAPTPPTTGAGDLTRSLTRQSVLVAAVCLFAGMLAFLLSGPVSELRSQDWMVLVMVAAADAALALPARFSGWVALAHAVVQVMAAVLTLGASSAHRLSGAGALIAGYRARAWLPGVTARIGAG